MPVSPTYPGVYIDELPSAVRTITGVPTSVVAFVGAAQRGATDGPRHVSSWAEYESGYGGLWADSAMSYAVYQYYLNGGSEAEIVRLAGANAKPAKLQLTITGNNQTTAVGELEAANPGTWGNKLEAKVDYETVDKDDSSLYNLIVRDPGTGAEERFLNVSTKPADASHLRHAVSGSRLVRWVNGADQRPNAKAYQGTGGADDAPTTSDFLGSETGKTGVHQLLKTDIFNVLCLPRAAATVIDAAAALCLKRRAILLVDPPNWADVDAAVTGMASPPVAGDAARNAALYFPNVLLQDPLANGSVREFPPCGLVAGVYARTDAQRGVWEAPAGTDAGLAGVRGLSVRLTDGENGRLNPLGVNCLRSFPGIGPVVWGARTLRGADRLADQWKYMSVRRLALFLEESLYRGTQWAVFAPNDEPLWASVRLNVGAFMNGLFRQGAFQGKTAREAYLVKCDRENNPQEDVDRGILNILVGFAPLKPAEFVLIHIQQLAGQSAA